MNRETTRQAVFQCIEGYYNRKQQHGALDYASHRIVRGAKNCTQA
ncbi:MAG: hypothetical protein PUP46_08185 [Endozoicomonas sp. (ex Botrylloides leachii)]|nr:hypothetical protein [Endozoicomonas sp. (ex Botrylloides leachii)]